MALCNNGNTMLLANAMSLRSINAFRAFLRLICQAGVLGAVFFFIETGACMM